MASKQHTFGQFETPTDVADLLLGFCLRRASDRLLDPSCGRGAFLQRVAYWQKWLANHPADITPDGLWGVELDPEMAQLARAELPQARILSQNFFTLEPDPERPFNAIIGNPPYTRAEWIGRLNRESGEQLQLDLPQMRSEAGEDLRQRLIPRALWNQLDSRSGLHAYFFLHALPFLREGGRLGFVVPNGWLDVAYGRPLKQFLLDHFRIIALIESSVERWFQAAKINTCLVVLEKCSDPQRRSLNQVRLVRLKKPLAELIPYPSQHRQRPVHLDQLITRLLPSSDRQTGDFDIRLLPQAELEASSKWGLALRAPPIYGQRLAQSDLPPLSQWASVHRGFTTGANAFFYLSPAAAANWHIEPEFRRPLLKSLRDLDHLRLTPEDTQYQLLHIPATIDIRQSAVAAYVAWGESQGYHLRRTCAARQPWYSLPEQEPPQLVLAKGIWRRHFACILEAPLPIDQQLYGLTLSPEISPQVAAALLNSSWFALQCELQGRINFGEGVLWLATYELEAIHLPDPRQLTDSQIDRLEQRFADLARRPLGNIEEELAQPDRQALDTAVFDLLGLSAAERNSVLQALQDRVATRLRRAAIRLTWPAQGDPG